jgi:signal transduction histidine kinase
MSDARRRTRAVTIGAVTIAGALLTVATAAATTMSPSDAVGLAMLAAGAAAVSAFGGAVALHLARSRTIAVQSAIAAVVAMLTVVVGVFGAAQAMFLTEEDVGALTVILVASTTVAAITAVLVGGRVGRASDRLAESARRVGEGATDLGTSSHLPHDLARLHAELSRSAARLDDARSRERALDQSRRELVAWVSHDLRTPLSGIRAMAEALEDGIVTDPEIVEQYHVALRIEADRLSELIDDLFELSRTQAGVLHLDVERVSLGDLVSDAIATATPIAATKGVELEGRLDGDSPELSVSAREVLRALRNILENAIRHTPNDGTVVVEAGVDGDRAYVTVRDTGGGISESDLPRVFDVAFRGDTARTPGGGAGLGLAIARGLVEAHRGEVQVRNENGGACFTVRLPLEEVDVS